jgi:hypothetical protein
MLLLALVLLLITALLGTALAALLLRAESGKRPPWPLQALRWPFGALHGGLGIVGLGALLLALHGPPRGEAMGVGAFGSIAAVLLAAAVLAGLVILAGRLRYRRAPPLVIGIHATIAISGVVILAAYTLVG